MGYKNLILEKKGNKAILTINHPPANVFGLLHYRSLSKRSMNLRIIKKVRVIALAGDGEKRFLSRF